MASLKPALCFTLHPALKNYFGYCLTKAAMRLRTKAEAALAPLGLIAPQFGILKVLNDSEPISQVKLGDEMGIDKATMVKLIDDLEHKKYVVRVPQKHDRRLNFLHITSSGKVALKKALKILTKVEKDFLSPISSDDKTTIRKIMHQLLS